MPYVVLIVNLNSFYQTQKILKYIKMRLNDHPLKDASFPNYPGCSSKYNTSDAFIEIEMRKSLTSEIILLVSKLVVNRKCVVFKSLGFQIEVKFSLASQCSLALSFTMILPFPTHAPVILTFLNGSRVDISRNEYLLWTTKGGSRHGYNLTMEITFFFLNTVIILNS